MRTWASSRLGGRAPRRATPLAARPRPHTPGEPQGDGPGHGPVRPQSRAGQPPPLGAQRGRGAGRGLLAAAGGHSPEGAGDPGPKVGDTRALVRRHPAGPARHKQRLPHLTSGDVPTPTRGREGLTACPAPPSSAPAPAPHRPRSHLSTGSSSEGSPNRERGATPMSARISPREGSAGLYTDGMQAPQVGLRRPSARAMRRRAVTSPWPQGRENQLWAGLGSSGSRPQRRPPRPVPQALPPERTAPAQTAAPTPGTEEGTGRPPGAQRDCRPRSGHRGQHSQHGGPGGHGRSPDAARPASALTSTEFD